MRGCYDGINVYDLDFQCIPCAATEVRKSAEDLKENDEDCVVQ